MKIGIESMFQILLLTGAFMILVTIVDMNQYLLEGRNSLYRYVDRIECSSKKGDTVKRCKNEAREEGYHLEAEQIGEESDSAYMLLTLTYERTYGGKKLFQGAVQAYAR